MMGWRFGRGRRLAAGANRGVWARGPLARGFRSGVTAGLFLCLVASAQETPRGKGRPGDAARPDEVYAPALTYGAELEKGASEDLRKWAEGYAKKDLREQPLDPQGTMAAVDARFASEGDETRDAITFLLFYIAYKAEDLDERMWTARLKDIDRETTEITRQLQVMWKNEQSRSASPMQGLSQQQRMANDEQVQKMESRLRELADERQLKSALLTSSRQKISGFLKLLAAVYPRMRGIKPGVLGAVQVS